MYDFTRETSNSTASNGTHFSDSHPNLTNTQEKGILVMNDTIVANKPGESTQDSTHRSKIIIRKIEKKIPKIGYRIAKRAFDIVASLFASILLLVPMLIIALIIKLDSKGPALYKQERLGLDGKPFMIHKFRSMRIDAESNGAQWAAKDDDRCTKVGRVIRNFRLDELPQIPLNVLVGNLSIVGPRPERKIFYDQFAEYIDGFDQRLYVKPGLTGLAQINGGYNLKPEEKIIYDLEYIENASVWMDIKIIFKTVKVIFSHEGAR